MRSSLLLVAALAMPSVADADIAISAAPAVIDAPVDVGRTAEGTVHLANIGSDPVTIHTYVQDWWYTPGGALTVPAAGASPRSAASWVSVRDREFQLAPGASRKVELLLAVPPDARGGHYAVVFFEAGDAHLSATGAMKVGVNGRLGVLVAHHDPARSAPALAVSGVAATVTPDEGTRIAVELDVTGDVHATPTGSAVIVDAAGRVIGKVALTPSGASTLLPGQRGRLTGELARALPPGRYEALVSVSYFAGKAVATKTAFVVP